MKRYLHFLCLIFCLSLGPSAFAQGWKAIVILNFGSGITPLSSIDYAVVTIAGGTGYGSSPSGAIQLEITGEGSPDGPVYIYASGRSWGSQSSYTSVTYILRSTGLCELYSLDADPAVNQYVSGWIMMFPQLRISDVTEGCDRVTLSTDVCADSFYTWEASESVSGPFRVIAETWEPSVELSGKEMAAAGLSRYGRKFFRVTGGPNTTSPLEVADFYSPGPAASFSITPPTCHNGSDGKIQVNVVSSYPSVIDDFIITVTPQAQGSRVRQFTLSNTSSLTVEGLSAGNYSIQITNHSSTDIFGQCWTDFEVGPLPDPPEVSVASFDVSDYHGFQISCKDATDGMVAVHPSGGTGTYTSFLWTPDVSKTATALNLGQGTYSVKVKDSNNCWSQEYKQVLLGPEQLRVALESTGGKAGFDVSCSDNKDGEITTNVSGGTPRYTFQWSTGDTLTHLAAADTGTYHLAVTDQNGCASSASLKLNAPETIDFSINQISGIDCVGNETGILEAQSVVNTIGSVYYAWSSGEAGKEITNKAAGTYTLTVSDEQGCQHTKSVTLEEPPSYSISITGISDFNGSPIRCHGEANGKLASIVTDEHQNVVSAEYYSWYRNQSEFLEGGNTNTEIEGLPAGIYDLKIKYRGSCEATATFALEDPEPLLPVILTESDYNGVPISCHGASDGSLSVRATGGTGYAYSWKWNSGATESLLTDLPAGGYSVTVTDINGCSGTAEKILHQPQPVEAVITVLSDYNGQALTCTGTSDARLRASAKGGTPPFAYSWNTGPTHPDLIDVPAGAYTVSVVDVNGCKLGTQKTIINPLPVKAQIAGASDFHGFGVSCHAASDGFLLAGGSGGTGSYIFDWNHGTNVTPRFHGLTAGTYTVKVIDENGCYDVTEAEIIEPSQLTLSISGIKDVACTDGMDGEIRLLSTGGAGDHLYSASGLNWQSEPVFTSLKAGSHHLRVQDENGCEQSLFQNLAEPVRLSITFENIEPALCGDPRGKVSARPSGGTGSYRYEWSDPQGQLISAQPEISSLMAGIYTLKVTDDHSCHEIQSVGISSTDGPRAAISRIVSPTCSYTRDGSALVEVAEGDGPFTFRWSNGQATPMAVDLGKGHHLVEIKDVNDCSVVRSLTLIAPDSMKVDVLRANEPTCNLDCDGEVVVAANGGNGDYAYQWEDFAGPQRHGLCAGEYSLVVTDQKGCLAEKKIYLNEPAHLSIDLMKLQFPTCMDGCDGAIAIQGSGGAGAIEYIWSTGATSPGVDNLCAGVYTATIKDSSQCTESETFVVDNPEESHLDLGGSVTLCEGQMHVLDPGSFWKSYAWKSNTGFSSNQQRVTLSTSGSYTLEAVTSQGCIARDTFLLQTSRDLLQANFLLATEAMIYDTLVVIDISWPLPETSLWSFPSQMDRLVDNGDVVYGKFNLEGLYNISLTATLGECRDEMTKSVTIFGGDQLAEEGRLGHEPSVREFTVYPNPNDGMFDVRVALNKTGSIILTVWNTLTATKLAQYQATDKKEYTVHIDLRPLSAGTYTMRLDHPEGTKYLRFMVR